MAAWQRLVSTPLMTASLKEQAAPLSGCQATSKPQSPSACYWNPVGCLFAPKRRPDQREGTGHPSKGKAAPQGKAYFCFDFRLILIALQSQRRASGFTRGVTYTQDSHFEQRKHPRRSRNAATTGSKSFLPKLAHSL